MGSIQHLTRYIPHLAQTAAAIEHFKDYIYGKNFTVITNHQALISALKASERSKTSLSRLTRWIEFDIKQMAGNNRGLFIYMSQNPVGTAIPLVSMTRNLLWRQSTHS